MPGPGLSGQAQSVLGPIAGEAMGITLPHEHLLIDFTVMFAEPADRGQRAGPGSRSAWPTSGGSGTTTTPTSTTCGWTTRRSPPTRPALRQAGGQTIVDPTNRSLARDPEALARVARATGLHIVMGSGYYVAAAHPPDMGRRTVDDLAREIVGDVTVGMGDSGIRAGLIGEIGVQLAVDRGRAEVLRAASWPSGKPARR